MVVVAGVRSKDPLPGRSFLGGLLKGGISIRQSMIGIWWPGVSTASLRGCEERTVKGCWVCGLLCVWHTVGSWDNDWFPFRCSSSASICVGVVGCWVGVECLFLFFPGHDCWRLFVWLVVVCGGVVV
jgi:hypothetical protein